MDFLRDYWFWIVIGVLFIWMHKKMHGGHGGGGHGGHGGGGGGGHGGGGGGGHGCCGGGGSDDSEDPRSTPDA